MSHNNSSIPNFILFANLLTFLFIFLKLIGFITWGWGWVLFPFMVSILLVIVTFIAIAIAAEMWK